MVLLFGSKGAVEGDMQFLERVYGGLLGRGALSYRQASLQEEQRDFLKVKRGSKVLLQIMCFSRAPEFNGFRQRTKAICFLPFELSSLTSPSFCPPFLLLPLSYLLYQSAIPQHTTAVSLLSLRGHGTAQGKDRKGIC